MEFLAWGCLQHHFRTFVTISMCALPSFNLTIASSMASLQHSSWPLPLSHLVKLVGQTKTDTGCNLKRDLLTLFYMKWNQYRRDYSAPLSMLLNQVLGGKISGVASSQYPYKNYTDKALI